MLRAFPGMAAILLLGLVAACSGRPPATDSSVGAPVEVDLSAADPDAAVRLRELAERAVGQPGNAAFRGELGMAYEINGYQLAAMASYEQAAALDPANPRWSYLLALSRAHSGDLEGALDAMQASLDLDPSYLSSYLHRGQWLLDTGDSAEAERSYRKVLELEPANRSAQLGLAKALLRQGRDQEVVDMLEAAAVERPGDGYLYQILGTAYRYQGDMAKARETLAKGKPDSEPPRWEDPWSEDKLQFVAGYGADMLQAEALLTSGRNAEAIALFESLRMRRPDDLQVLNNLSVAYRRAGQAAKSLEVLEAGVEIHPDYFPFHMNLSTAYERAGDLDRALEHLDRVIELNPSLGLAYQRKGMILIHQERLEEALSAYEAALSYESGNPTNFLYAGVLATKLDQCDRAIPWLETATRMQPQLVPGFLSLSECRAKDGDFVGAELALDRVEEIAPQLKSLVAARELVAELQSQHP